MKIRQNNKKSFLGFILILLLLGFFMNCAHKKMRPNSEVDEYSNNQNSSANNYSDSNLSNDNLGSDRTPNRVKSSSIHEDFYLSKIQNIFNSRCVVCHACREAPCTLYLNSYSGVTRGSLIETEAMSSILEKRPLRMKDGKSIADWRKKGFSKVVADNPKEKSLKNSLLFRFVENGFNHNNNNFSLASAQEYSNNHRYCPKNADEFNDFLDDYPDIGMPFSLPALTKEQFEDLRLWIAHGSQGPSALAQKELETPFRPDYIKLWEDFFNNKGIKNQLFSKYIYEHSFVTHIHFAYTPSDEFYELIRSSTEGPAAINEIVTDRPIDPIQQSVFYYRLKKVTESIVRKNHILWELDELQKNKWNQFLNDPNWKTPPQESINDPSGNPFERFKYIPAKYRYQFLLDNAYMIANSMIRGPVCTGKKATFAIRDQFWVMFLKPEVDRSLDNPEKEKEWESLTSLQNIKLEGYKLSFGNDEQVYNVESIWDGDGYNQNAFLTIFRHELSASVQKGLIGGMPNTLWVLNFSNFERIYYNLVAEFKQWGSAAHQYSTFTAMTKHRQEAEERFLMMFPKDSRQILHDQWEEGIFSNNSILLKSSTAPNEHKLVFKFMTEIQKRIPKNVLANNFDINIVDSSENEKYSHWEKMMNEFLTKNGRTVAKYFPNIAFIKFENKAYTLITNKYFKFHDIVVVDEEYARNPDFDTLVMLKGLVGDRPELFFELNTSQIDLFIKMVEKIKSKEDWVNIKKQFAQRRNEPKFWSLFDWFTEFDKKNDPLESGILDLNYYDLTTW